MIDIIIYSAVAFIFLLIDFSSAPFKIFPIFSVSLSVVGPLILNKKNYLIIILILSLIAYLLSSIDQFFKIFFSLSLPLLFYSIIPVKNIFIIILISVLFSTIIIINNDFNRFLSSLVLNEVLAILIYKTYIFLKNLKS